ncbi:MAG TPA: GGDEF domain-containing protein [Bacillota bacterium]|nr:GGDEF domain-containing protein [Bacillota bacterium]
MGNNLQKVDRSLWLITGATSFPFVILALVRQSALTEPHIYILMALAGLFNGLIVPFLLMRGRDNWIKKTIALGVNLIIAFFWIEYTGGLKSIFFPTFYLLPILAATMYGGLIDSLITATFASLLSLWVKAEVTGFGTGLIKEPGILVQIILFFLVASTMGYLLKHHREQSERSKKMTEELEIAYHQLTATHDQLQSYTGIIEKMNREMEQLAITDELTGLFNYRYFQITMDKEIKRNRHSYLTLVMFDADNFKGYNDKFGHVAGDRMLAEIAKTLKGGVREVDTVCRYGGEEFAIIMPSTEAQEAFKLAETLRKAIENIVMTTPEGRPSSVTVSCGISCFPIDSKTKSEIISHADLAMFEAKTEGRNRTAIFSKASIVEVS